jgi:glucoamylase
LLASPGTGSALMRIGETVLPQEDAPGAPGIAPTWTSSNKDLVGTSLGPGRLWFTLGFGIVNEVYYPRVDIPQIRDLGFIVADGKGFWCEIKRLDNYELRLPSPGIPAPTIVHRHERFELGLRIAPDPQRDVLLLEVVLTGDPDLRPYVLLAPHVGGSGRDNAAAAGRHYHRKVLWAEQGPFGLALVAADSKQGEAFGRLSAGYVGFSDGWQDFAANKAMSWQFDRAGPGNVAMLGELARSCVLALGFGSSRGAAASLASAALAQPFDQAWSEHVGAWRNWHAVCHRSIGIEAEQQELDEQFATSRMVLRCHMDKINPGAMVASLSVPWGNSRDDRAGYHLVWPRDLVQCATALLGVGGDAEARDVLRYLIATQYEDGHWNQNQWLGGTPFWHGIQLDETALPVLLVSLLNEHAALADIEVAALVRRALAFIIRNGPVTDQDRWEEDRGINAFTLAVTIAALVAGAEFLSGPERSIALDVADDWNARIESWLFVRDSSLARQFRVAGHYMRMAPPEVCSDPEAVRRVLPIKNLNVDPELPYAEQVSTDFLQLVRFGLRSPNDSGVRDSLVIIDGLLRVETQKGFVWHRYNHDGYGEHDDGSEYDGTGRGRGWPLLTGERGHYELLAGNEVAPYLLAMCAMAGRSGMLPEQVWDAEAIPEKRLSSGSPTGSAMPLAWTHAEFVKLFLSTRRGRSFDCPRVVFERYKVKEKSPGRSVWSQHAPAKDWRAGSQVRVILGGPSEALWRDSPNAEWHRASITESLPGVYTALLPTSELPAGSRIDLTLKDPGGQATPADYHMRAI